MKPTTSEILGVIQVGNIIDYPPETLKDRLSKSFPNFKVSALPALPDPSEAYVTKRGQYHSTRILALLEKHVQNIQANRILGLTAFDLYVPGMSFVFGEARCPGRAAIISTRRLKPSPRKNQNLLGKRVLKEAVHEVGHMLGLKHCPNAPCVMYFSEHIRDTDRKESAFCIECRSQLKSGKFE